MKIQAFSWFSAESLAEEIVNHDVVIVDVHAHLIHQPFHASDFLKKLVPQDLDVAEAYAIITIRTKYLSHRRLPCIVKVFQVVLSNNDSPRNNISLSANHRMARSNRHHAFRYIRSAHRIGSILCPSEFSSDPSFVFLKDSFCHGKS